MRGMARTPAESLAPGRPLTLAGVADGAEGLVVADLARAVAARADAPATSLVVVCRDGPRMAALARALGFFAPDLDVAGVPGLGLPALRPGLAACGLRRPAHDGAVAAGARRRAATARRSCSPPSTPRSSACRREDFVARQSLVGRARQHARDGRHHRAGSSSTASRAPRPCASPATTRCAAASSISIAPGMAEPVRLDFFGDTLETIRSFDPETQRTTDQLRALDLVPVAEFQLTTETIRRFRTRLCRGVRRPDARRPALLTP